MDADCLIKLTKSELKEIVCKNFSVTIPQIVKEEVIDNAQGYPDAMVIKKNLEKNLLAVNIQPSLTQKGEEAIFAIFQHGKYDAICSDDKRFIKRLRFFNIPYITPSVFIAILLKWEKLSIDEANKKLSLLSPFISDDEYNIIKLILEEWSAQ